MCSIASLPSSGPRIYIKRDELMWLQTSIQFRDSQLCWLSLHIPLEGAPPPIAVVRCDDWVVGTGSEIREEVEQCVARVLSGGKLFQIVARTLELARTEKSTLFTGAVYDGTPDISAKDNPVASTLFDLVGLELRKTGISTAQPAT